MTAPVFEAPEAPQTTQETQDGFQRISFRMTAPVFEAPPAPPHTTLPRPTPPLPPTSNTSTGKWIKGGEVHLHTSLFFQRKNTRLTHALLEETAELVYLPCATALNDSATVAASGETWAPTHQARGLVASAEPHRRGCVPKPPVVAARARVHLLRTSVTPGLLQTSVARTFASCI